MVHSTKRLNILLDAKLYLYFVSVLTVKFMRTFLLIFMIELFHPSHKNQVLEIPSTAKYHES